jgi:hypothetical protein
VPRLVLTSSIHSACAASIYKTILQTKVLADPDSFRNDSYVLWNSIEFNIGLLAASLPTLRPLFARAIESTKRFVSSSGSHNKSSAIVGGPSADGYYKQNDSIAMAAMPSHGEQRSNSGSIARVTTDPKRSRHRNDDDGDSEEGILPPYERERGRISVKKEATVVWEDV